jgi:hypothetical protein
MIPFSGADLIAAIGLLILIVAIFPKVVDCDTLLSRKKDANKVQ